MTPNNPSGPPQDRTQSLDELQDQLQANQNDTIEIIDAISIAVDQRKPASTQATASNTRFHNHLRSALIRRAANIQSNLNHARHHRELGAHAARLACLEQATAEWKWFTWILEHQSDEPENANQACTECGLARMDQSSHNCPSCYDIEISNALAR